MLISSLYHHNRELATVVVITLSTSMACMHLYTSTDKYFNTCSCLATSNKCTYNWLVGLISDVHLFPHSRLYPQCPCMGLAYTVPTVLLTSSVSVEVEIMDPALDCTPGGKRPRTRGSKSKSSRSRSRSRSRSKTKSESHGYPCGTKTGTKRTRPRPHTPGAEPLMPEDPPMSMPHTPRPHTPGRHTPRPHTPRPHTPGPHTPGRHTPRPYTPGRHTPRPHTPGRHTPKPHTPRPHTPRPHTPGRHTPRPHTPGPEDMGDDVGSGK